MLRVGSQVIEAFREHERRQRAEHDELRRVGIEPEGGLVFTRSDGRLVSPRRFGDVFDGIARRGLPHIRFHDLRHTFATRALEHGANVKTVSDILGHANVGFTLSTYAHAVPSLEEEAMGALERNGLGSSGDAFADGEHPQGLDADGEPG